MGVKPGYKETEVGVIPEEWELQYLGQVTGITTGRKDVNEGNPLGEYPFFTCSREHTFSDSHSFNTEAILIAGNGDVGMLHYYSGKFEAYQRTYVLTHFGSNVRYIWYQLDYRLVRSLGLGKIGTSIPYIKKGNLTGFVFPAPPTDTEQRAIAEALSDVDALLNGLERLIAKKRDIKQATMQQLLTGKTRLPGFSGEWEMKRLGEIADIRSGGTPSTAESRFWNGDIPWCTPTDITSLNGYKYLGDTSRTITHLGLDASSAELIPANSVVMTSRATIGECAINTVPVSTNQGLKNFVPFGTTDVHFLYYLLGMQKQAFISICGGSTFLEIGRAQLVSYNVSLPKTKSEQSAIAEVLSTIDAELASLIARRDKTRALKQAMMQELLTGRTRLISRGDAEHAEEPS